MIERIKTILRINTPSLEKRVEIIEMLLSGDDSEPEKSNWSYKDIRQILDRTDLVPNMSNQELMNIAPSYLRIENRLENLGKTDSHTGEKTLEYRLNIIEGCIDILHMSHMGHTNFADAEFKSMHGFIPIQLEGNIPQRVDGIQKKLDRITKLLENAEFTIKGKEAMKL
jgi:hypothetical protein